MPRFEFCYQLRAAETDRVQRVQVAIEGFAQNVIALSVNLFPGALQSVEEVSVDGPSK